MASTNRIHYYHADACGFGGYFESPIEHTIPPQASMSLSPSGGYGSIRTENFRLEGLVSYKSVSSQVSGRLSKKDGGGWVTTSSSVVEGLNVMDVVTADRLSAQISTEHPLQGDYPKVSFLGTSFENLKIAGCPVEVTLDLDICDQGNGRNYPDGPCVNDERFLDKAAEHYRRINDAKNLPEWVKIRTVPEWIKERYKWDGEEEECGNVLCSVVQEVNGKFPGTPFGNVIELPDIGRLFLGELLVDCQSYRLIMTRLELGCRSHGNLSGPICLINGHTIPP